MRTHLRLGMVGACVLLLSAWCGAAEGDLEAKRKAALGAVRKAAASRDLAGVKERLAEAKKLEGDAEYNAQYERLDELCDYLSQFWKSVDKAARTLTVAEEFKVGDNRVAVVEFDGNSLTLHVNGENRKYTLQNVPPKVCLALAQQALKADDPRNKVCFASFLLLDGQGDRAAAKRLLEEAKKGGVDVARFLPELEGLPATTAGNIDTPSMTPAMRGLLSPANWQVRQSGEKGFARAPLDKSLAQGKDGFLEAKLPAGDGDKSATYQLTTRRTFGGNFGLRLVISDLPEKQSLVFTSETGGDQYTASLPGGTVMIELGRQGSELRCRINQQDVELSAAGKANNRLAGLVGITLPAGAQVKVTAMELAGR